MLGGSDLLQLYRPGRILWKYEEMLESEGRHTGIEVRVPAEMGDAKFGAIIAIPRGEVESLLGINPDTEIEEKLLAELSRFSRENS
jgi:hypothetical protein